MGEGKAEVVVQSIASGVKKVQALRRVTPKAGWRGPVGLAVVAQGHGARLLGANPLIPFPLLLLLLHL